MAAPLVIDTSAWAKPGFREWLATYYGDKIMPAIAYAEALVFLLHQGDDADTLNELLTRLPIKQGLGPAWGSQKRHRGSTESLASPRFKARCWPRDALRTGPGSWPGGERPWELPSPPPGHRRAARTPGCSPRPGETR